MQNWNRIKVISAYEGAPARKPVPSLIFPAAGSPLGQVFRAATKLSGHSMFRFIFPAPGQLGRFGFQSLPVVELEGHSRLFAAVRTTEPDREDGQGRPLFPLCGDPSLTFTAILGLHGALELHQLGRICLAGGWADVLEDLAGSLRSSGAEVSAVFQHYELTSEDRVIGAIAPDLFARLIKQFPWLEVTVKFDFGIDVSLFP